MASQLVLTPVDAGLLGEFLVVRGVEVEVIFEVGTGCVVDATKVAPNGADFGPCRGVDGDDQGSAGADDAGAWFEKGPCCWVRQGV